MWTKAPSRDLVLVCQKEVIRFNTEYKAEGLKSLLFRQARRAAAKYFAVTAI